MDWQTDSRLTRRMALALALSAVGYAVLLGPVVHFLPLSAALVVCGVLLAVLGGLVLGADRLAYLATGAVAVEREDHPELFDTVDRLAAQADLPRPPVAVIPSDEPNAMSAGTGNRTVVCVTLGLLKELDDEQLEAVLAHELAHVKNGDSSVLTVAGFPATVALAMLSAALDSMNGTAVLLGYFGAAVFVAFLSLPLLVVSLPGTLALSRYREYAADRGAVALTGRPVALAEALAEVHGLPEPPEEDVRSLAAFNAFCIVPSAYLGLPGTHPPTHERIRKLRELAAEMER
jgi:heat shock protein HtpX